MMLLTHATHGSSRMGGGMYKCCDIKDTEALRRHELQQTAPEISSALDGPQIESIKMPVAQGAAESGVPEQKPGTETIPNQGSRVVSFLARVGQFSEYSHRGGGEIELASQSS